MENSRQWPSMEPTSEIALSKDRRLKYYQLSSECTCLDWESVHYSVRLSLSPSSKSSELGIENVLLLSRNRFTSLERVHFGSLVDLCRSNPRRSHLSSHHTYHARISPPFTPNSFSTRFDTRLARINSEGRINLCETRKSSSRIGQTFQSVVAEGKD